MRVGPDFAPVSAEFLLRRAFALVLAVLAHITATIFDVSSNVATIGANVFGVRPNLAAIGSQFSSFPAIDISLTCCCYCARCKERGQQQDSS